MNAGRRYAVVRYDGFIVAYYATFDEAYRAIGRLIFTTDDAHHVARLVDNQYQQVEWMLTSELKLGDDVVMPGGVIRTVGRVVPSEWHGIVNVWYLGPVDDRWGNGNSAAHNSKWEVLL